MEPIVPYIHFNGNAIEAMAFYEKALGGKILFQQTYGDSPMPTPDSHKEKIMHATFQAGELSLMVSDCPPEYDVKQGNDISLSLNFDSMDSIKKTFDAMAEGATIKMPLQDTFWGAHFGMITDKFGINWMFNFDLQKKDK